MNAQTRGAFHSFQKQNANVNIFANQSFVQPGRFVRSFGIADSKFVLLNPQQDGEAQQGVNVFALSYFKTRPYKELCRRQPLASIAPFLSRRR